MKKSTAASFVKLGVLFYFSTSIMILYLLLILWQSDVLSSLVWLYSLSETKMSHLHGSGHWTVAVCLVTWFFYQLVAKPGNNADIKVHGANMGPIRGRQDPGGPPVGPMNFAISEDNHSSVTWPITFLFIITMTSHEHQCIWKHCLCNISFSLRTKKKSKVYITGPLWGECTGYQ